MSRTFTKLFSSITESTVWCEPDQVRIVWIAMLAMADRNGRVWASIPGLANRARVPLEAAQQAIDRFLSPDPYSRTPDYEGRRIEAIDGGWRLLNHEKYRQIRDEESIRESKRKYINERRAAERVEKSRTESNAGEPGRANAEADTEAVKIKRPRKRLTSLPPDFTISESVKAWAEQKGFTRLPERLEHFKNWATAKGATYADWDAAFRNAISGDWAKLNGSAVASSIWSTDRAWQDFRSYIQAGKCPDSGILRDITVRMGGSNRLGEMSSRDLDFKRKEFDQHYHELQLALAEGP